MFVEKYKIAAEYHHVKKKKIFRGPPQQEILKIEICS